MLIVGLLETGVLAHAWLPALVGTTYLAAAAPRSRETLWGPGLVLTTVGLAAALRLRDGRSVDSVQSFAVAVLALGLGGVLAALLAQARGLAIGPMSIALPVLLFGAFALVEQQAIAPFVGQRGRTGAAARDVGRPRAPSVSARLSAWSRCRPAPP